MFTIYRLYLYLSPTAGFVHTRIPMVIKLLRALTKMGGAERDIDVERGGFRRVRFQSAEEGEPGLPGDLFRHRCDV